MLSIIKWVWKEGFESKCPLALCWVCTYFWNFWLLRHNPHTTPHETPTQNRKKIHIMGLPQPWLYSWIHTTIWSRNIKGLAFPLDKLVQDPMDNATWHLFLLFSQWCFVFAPTRGAHEAQGDPRTIESILGKGLEKLARQTLLFHSSYASKFPFLMIHLGQLSSPQTPPPKPCFGLCWWIFRCNVCLCPFFLFPPFAKTISIL